MKRFERHPATGALVKRMIGRLTPHRYARLERWKDLHNAAYPLRAAEISYRLLAHKQHLITIIIS